MKFLIEKGNRWLELYEIVIDGLIKINSSSSSYMTISIEDLENTKTNYSDYIPLGSFIFQELFYKKYFGIKKLNPLEIPECLRQEQFLKRAYQILPANQIPKEGNYFIKDATTQKAFSYLGNLRDIPKLDETHIYVLSEPVNIFSEWRVYYMNNEVRNLVHYYGNPHYFPDMKIIEDTMKIYSKQKDFPKALTIDLMVTDKGTSLVELHPLSCADLYTTIWDIELFQGLKDSRDYIIKYNTPPKLSI